MHVILDERHIARIAPGILMQDRDRGIGRTVVTGKHPHIRRGLCQQRIQLLGQIALAVVCGKADVDHARAPSPPCTAGSTNVDTALSKASLKRSSVKCAS